MILASKVNLGIKIKFKAFPMMMISLNFEMVCYIMMGYYLYLMALFNSKFSMLTMMHWYKYHFEFNETMEFISRYY